MSTQLKNFMIQRSVANICERKAHNDVFFFDVSSFNVVTFIHFFFGSFVPSHSVFSFVFVCFYSLLVISTCFWSSSNCWCLFFSVCIFCAQVKNVPSSSKFNNNEKTHRCCCIDDRVLIAHKIAHWLKIIGLTSFAFVFLLFISFLIFSFWHLFYHRTILLT